MEKAVAFTGQAALNKIMKRGGVVRKANAIPGGAAMPLDRKRSLNINTAEWVNQKIQQGDIEGGMSSGQSGTSIFDPVLCELAYRWFCPPGGLILDPFAGGSVRGIVAVHFQISIRRAAKQEVSARPIRAYMPRNMAAVAGNPDGSRVGIGQNIQLRRIGRDLFRP